MSRHRHLREVDLPIKATDTQYPCEPEHHHAVSGCRHKVVVLLDDFAVLPMVQTELLEPIVEVPEHLEATGFHACEHVENARFDTDAAIFELGMVIEHVEALRPVLVREGDAGAFQGLPAAVPGPWFPQARRTLACTTGVASRSRWHLTT